MEIYGWGIFTPSYKFMKSFRYNINSKGTCTGWQVGEQLFYNKWDAVQHATDKKLPYNAYLNNNKWNSADWTQEPTESIEQLQKNYAEYLREKYKTLVLFYSGGPDSQVILDTFIDNNIPIDYIWLHYVGEYSQPHNKDIHLAMQYLEQNKSKLMSAEILCERYLETPEGNSICNFKGILRDVNYQSRFHHCGNGEILQLRQPNVYRKVEDNGCIITGSNKPYVFKDDNGFYMQHVDCDDENWGQPYHEMFWLGEDPALQIKQCHLAKKWLEQNEFLETPKIYQDKNSGNFLSLNLAIGRKFINKHFNKKLCFGSWIEDNYFGQHYGKNWCNSYWVNDFNNWKESNSYHNLVRITKQEVDKKFLNDHDLRLVGWLTEKRYLD